MSISDSVQPLAKRSITNSTARRVPLITGFPTRIFGSRDMRSCQLIIDHVIWTIKIYLLRAEGKSPDEIIEYFSDRYGMYAYQGDLINWLDQMVRYLEAIASVAKVLGKMEAAGEAEERKKRIEGE